MYNKPILHGFDEQIERLKENGIKFEYCDEDKAKDYLKNHNYYFKLTSYRKNFDKEPENNLYTKLDFFALIEMARIDMMLRMVVMRLSLNVEHYIKLYLINYISNRKNNYDEYIEDGYSIVKDYFGSLDDKNKKKLNEEITRNINSVYCCDLLNRIADGIDIAGFDYIYNSDVNQWPIFQMNIPIWAFVEMITFGSIVSFVKFFGDYYQEYDFKNKHYLLKTCNKIRNAAAHSSCILNDLRKGNYYKKFDYTIKKELLSIIAKNELRNRLSNERIAQFTTLLYLHKEVVTSNSVINRVKAELSELKKKMFENIDKIDNDLIKNNFNFIKKIIDFWY